MAQPRGTIEIDFVDCCFRTRVVNAAVPQPFESYPLVNFQGITPVYVPGAGAVGTGENTNYRYTDMLQFNISFLVGTASVTFKYDVQDVSNQAGWTANLAGLNQAIADICAAHGACVGSGTPITGFALETTLAALNAKFNSLGQKASAASAPVVLSTEQEAILDAIKTAVEAIDLDADSLATELTLVALSAKFGSLGQKVSAGSAPVVLSTEQEAILATIDAVLDGIKVDTGNMAVDLAAIEILLTTIDTVLDNILLDTSTLATPVTGLAMGLTRATDATGSPIAAGKRSILVFNAGGADGSVNGGTIKPGESLPWIAYGLRDTLAAFTYDGTGTELIITTVG